MKDEIKIKRIPEIDLFRGTAVIMMILFHTIFDLDFFSLYTIDISSGFWFFFGYITGFLFVFIAGISAWISWKRVEKKLSGINIYKKFVKRGLFIFVIGLGITAVTWIFAPGSPIIFGTLHLIGFSIMVAPLFFRFSTKIIYIGLAVIFAGILIQGLHGDPLLTITGIHAPGFSSLDYKPLIPWFGYFLAGIAISAFFYPEGKKMRITDTIIRPVPEFIQVIGRHSLVIYLVHQPVIIILLSIIYGKMLLSV
ncbi:MAG: DUF1624 domain-containing protein [Methanomicrobiaceae archaeon]|nr:DUF1624 domain-containing protein [Methanomicrobiaceae archaeon]